MGGDGLESDLRKGAECIGGSSDFLGQLVLRTPDATSCSSSGMFL